MYADTGLLLPYFQNFSQEIQQLEEYCKTQKPNASMSNLIPASSISDYDLGVEGDLFKAPEPIIEEPIMCLDPMNAAISMISCAEDVISSQGLKATDISTLHNDQLLSEVFYECKKDILEKAAIEGPLSEILDIKVTVSMKDEKQVCKNEFPFDVPFQKSISSGCLSSMDLMPEAPLKPAFLDFPGMDLGAVYGMRRAFSEGDIKTLGNVNTSLIQSPQQPLIFSNCTSEERQEKLSRYRNKKNKRNFGRKIKYACRKALADSQPRIRGRFAKAEDSDGRRQ